MRVRLKDKESGLCNTGPSSSSIYMLQLPMNLVSYSRGFEAWGDTIYTNLVS